MDYEDTCRKLINSRTAVAEVMKLKDLVAYQTGAVVSKALLDVATGSATAFAFDEGQGLSEHTAPYDALVIVVEGEVDMEISGKTYHLNEAVRMTAGRDGCLFARLNQDQADIR